jgi:hypothetical protein
LVLPIRRQVHDLAQRNVGNQRPFPKGQSQSSDYT